MTRIPKPWEISLASQNQNKALEQLLWEVLWQPLDFKQTAQAEFKLESEETRFVAIVDDSIVGAMVVNTTDVDEYEIRHIAVKEPYQSMGIGRALVHQLIADISTDKPARIRTIARSTSQAFFKQLGFQSIQDYPDHPIFIEHGITFCLMEKTIAGE